MIAVSDTSEFIADRRRPARRVPLADLTILVRIPGLPAGVDSPARPPEALAFTAAEEAAAARYAEANGGRLEHI